ncbi:L-threonylcarbamoyladenylate synthase [Flavobacterium sp.]|jgi:L-threonylcarbamoyladenylate synthase|uniref:L-threonylcarbamoyladenylate synthase n=1 Tax=Flavobacterium sp. TaxID=239 RepID=UPI0022CAB80F|nr:L-threonylcarbamoyladenylate synthase [Flavobacterium sp.]MCZ8145980.1 L-threonylcarbamoyladenylate synthase [Flavobacterium sp.]MCZ8368094.1 L-threonylcarbamoyladenylate synthase [Flavobacterium sp.]
MELKLIAKEVHNAFEVIAKGGIILYPTDTVWGIGCDATNEAAVQKIYALKQREESKSMIVLMHSERLVHSVFHQIPEVAWQLLEFATQPTTLILDQPKNVAPNLISTDNSLGMRLVTEPFCYQLMERMKRPLVSTSANVSGAPTPKSFQEISPEIVQGVDYVVQLHRDRVASKPSTIIKLTLDAQVRVIRK